MKAKPIMIQGTASSSGKSLITAALCRIFHQDGFRVAPFKAQNMSNNSFVTRDGLEMGRAQVVLAYAAGLEPDVRMNPVLLKPSSDTGSQVVLQGKPSFIMNAKEWHDTRNRLRCTIKECYESIALENEIMVIEGAGSPAEINLKENDIVNMGMANMADSPVIIVGDIDRGGVFASLVGTMELLENDERARVKGFIINKFRGDTGLLKDGLEKLEEMTSVPVLGVVPWIEHAIDEEDGVSNRFECKNYPKSDIDICIIRLPHISNYTDFLPLENVGGVTVRWCDSKDKIGSPDLLIIPGTKTTVIDLKKLKESGVADEIIAYAKRGNTVFGVCGGFQMMGKVIYDPDHCESSADYETGLGLLDMKTSFFPQKITEQVKAQICKSCFWLFPGLSGSFVNGYEIHMGKTEFGDEAVPLLYGTDRNGKKFINGVTDKTGKIAGTYLHGLFDSSRITTGVINALRKKKGLEIIRDEIMEHQVKLNKDIDYLAGIVKGSIDMDAIYKIMGIGNVCD